MSSIFTQHHVSTSPIYSSHVWFLINLFFIYLFIFIYFLFMYTFVHSFIIVFIIFCYFVALCVSLGLEPSLLIWQAFVHACVKMTRWEQAIITASTRLLINVIKATTYNFSSTNTSLINTLYESDTANLCPQSIFIFGGD